MRHLQTARDLMLAIGNLTDIDIAEAHHSKAMMDTATDGLRPMQRTLDFLLARQWAGKAARKDYDTAWADLLSNYIGSNLLGSVKFYFEHKGRLSEPREQRILHTVRAAA